MKKSVRILIIVLCLIIIGLVTFIMVDKFINTKKEGKSNNKSNNVIVEENNIKEVEENNTTSTNNVKKDEQTPISDNNENKNSSNIANEAIREELRQRQFLAKNNIDIDSEAKFVKIADNLYFIHVNYEQDESGNRSTYFLVTYKNGQVIFNKQFEHKYVYDVSIDFDNLVIKAETAYKGFVRDLFGKINNGEYSQISDIIKPANEDYEDTVKYQVNQTEVSQSEYEKESNKYNKYNFVSFESKAVELNDVNIDKYVR